MPIKEFTMQVVDVSRLQLDVNANNVGEKPTTGLPYGKNSGTYTGAVGSYSAGPSQDQLLSLSTRSRQSCCSEHDPPPRWFTPEMPPLIQHLLGTFLALLAGLFLTVGGLIISMVKTLSPLEISGLRSLVACVYLVPLLLYFRPKHDFGRSQFVELLGVSLVFCVKFATFSIGSTILPLSEFSLLCNTVPVFTAFLGCVLLAEHCGLREWLSCFVVMLGVATSFVPNLVSGSQMLAAKTFKQTELTGGYVITVTSALSSAIALCWLRRLKEVHSLLIAFYACIITGIICMVTSMLTGQYRPPTDPRDVGLICLAALCMLSQALLPAIACSLTQASRVAVAMTFSVVFSFLLQTTVQGVQPTLFAFGGGFLIIVAMMIGNTPYGNSEEAELVKAEAIAGSQRYGSMSEALDRVR
ncbi:solute carrier family 35 member G2-like isoform X3 [Varroa jacobsoni]|uniref:solute carrier family 35 member G2-like isoform X3 n=1 Tax=Varroa jacobsoni TaxID=62625 RepID=UPI000BF361BD|nr:solute carrier family 35 member G2-like isoform X3 [Varroa jacobsoni]